MLGRTASVICHFVIAQLSLPCADNCALTRLVYLQELSMTAMMLSLLFAFLACVDVRTIQKFSCCLAESFLRDSLGDMSLSVQEYAI